MTVRFPNPLHPGWRGALTGALQELGARRVWSTRNGEVSLEWYRIGWRFVLVEWDVWTGLVLRGHSSVITGLAAAVDRVRGPAN